MRLKRGRGVQKFTLAKTSRHHAFVRLALHIGFAMSVDAAGRLVRFSLRATQPGFVIQNACRLYQSVRVILAGELSRPRSVPYLSLRILDSTLGHAETLYTTRRSTLREARALSF